MFQTAARADENIHMPFGEARHSGQFGVGIRYQRSQLRSRSKEIIRESVIDPVGPELFAGICFGFRYSDFGFVSLAEPTARERLSLSSLVHRKNWLLSVSPEKPIQLLLPDLIFSGRGLVTRPIIVDDVTWR